MLKSDFADILADIFLVQMSALIRRGVLGQPGQISLAGGVNAQIYAL
jgi:hypothetical protein